MQTGFIIMNKRLRGWNKKMSGVFSFYKEHMKKEMAERGIRYGGIGARDKEKGICDKGSDHAGQEMSASDSGDWYRFAKDKCIHQKASG